MVDYKVIRCHRKTVGISIDEYGQVTVCAPKGIPISEIREIVKKRNAWIEKKILRVKTKNTIVESIEQEGAIYRLGAKVSFLMVKSDIKENVKAFYGEGHKYLRDRIYFLSQKLNLKFTKLSFNYAKTVWGSCNGVNAIKLNERLYSLPVELSDYVIIHELVHTLHHNHSKSFWNALEYYLPGARALQRKLYDYKWVLEIYTK